MHISLDASGSIGGASWAAAIKTATAIAKAATMITSLRVIISYRGTFNNGKSDQPLMHIIYDSKVDKFSVVSDLFKYVQANGGTPEGLCFESIQKEIESLSVGSDGYFINMSDGCPGWNNYYNGEEQIGRAHV